MERKDTGINRRDFIKTGAGAGLYLASGGYGALAAGCSSGHPVRIGFVGVGGRGTSILKVALSLGNIEIPAICDISEEKAERARRLVEATGQPKPLVFTGEKDYLKMAGLNNLDAIYTATPTELHVPIMLAAMRGGKYGGTEMPACNEYDQAWELVETSEKTGKPCMLMENYAYMRNTMMVLVMARIGLFGELTHCECGYQHDARYASFGPNGEMLWRAYGGKSQGNPYPTHAIGPVSQWININRGNRFEYLVSMSSRSLGKNYYAAKKFGPDHPAAKIKYSGDVNTSLIQTSEGITVTLYYDARNPRPFDCIYRIQGIKGIYSGTLNKIYLEDISPIPDKWEDIEKYQEKYEHPLWSKYGEQARSTGHGGGDYLCFRDFAEAVRRGRETPIDVYDSVTWSIITKLSAESVINKGRPIDFPDFTRGQWKTRLPRAIEEK